MGHLVLDKYTLLAMASFAHDMGRYDASKDKPYEFFTDEAIENLEVKMIDEFEILSIFKPLKSFLFDLTDEDAKEIVGAYSRGYYDYRAEKWAEKWLEKVRDL